MKFYPFVLILGVLTMLLSITAASWKGLASTEIAIIVHKDNPTEKISLADARLCYLTAEPKQWPQSTYRVEAVCRQNTCMENEIFCARVLHMATEDVQKYCFTKSYTAGHASVRRLDSDSDIIRYVSQTPGAIGYVNAKSLKSEAIQPVKILLTLSK